MNVWDIIILNPILNILIILTNFLFHNFGLAIIVLTIIVRLLMLPLTLKQLRVSKVMGELAPKLEALKVKYGKDQARMNQEVARLYKESGMNPAGCILPMLIQMPIWIALYQGINQAITLTPQLLVDLHPRLYSWTLIHQTIPLGEQFLWLNLGVPDSYYLLPILVAVTMWIQQKMSTAPAANAQQKQQNTMMLWMMPILFGVMTAWVPSGLALYWFVSNIIGIIIQYFVTGWGELKKDANKSKDVAKKRTVPVSPMRETVKSEEQEVSETAQDETEGITKDGNVRNERKDRTASNRPRSRTTKSNNRRGRGYGNSRK